MTDISGNSVRYFRLKSPSSITGLDVHAEAREVEWLSAWKPGKFFSLPGSISLVSNEHYQTSQVFGLDAASAAAVWALEPGTSDRVLDLCCAPGGKMMLLAEETKEVTGVDVAMHRLCTTRALAKKYSVKNVRLMHGSGVDAVETWAKLPMDRKRKASPDEGATHGLWDKVLVDAECTHDASTRHVEKQAKLHGQFRSPWEGKETQLFELQLGLLLNGIDLVKPGGLVVYSTCSGKIDQNERVVETALARKRGVVELDFLPFVPEDCGGAETRIIATTDAVNYVGHISEVTVSKTQASACFFDPHKTRTSGLFVCRLKKL
jgi:16S rRNA C967 or C1407 C5-methylase (RsmB/RsmF family)